MVNSIPKRENRPVKYFAFVLGFTSIIAQIVLLRELSTVFYGNETAYAIILASWLFWIAVGSSIFSRFTRRIKNPLGFIAILQWVMLFVLPSTIILARSIKQIMNVPTGTIIGIMPMCLATFLLLGPLTFILGALFSLICRTADSERLSQESSLQVGTIYLWEAIGATAGGLLFSFVLIHFLSAMHIAFLIGLINIAAVLYLCFQRKCAPTLSLITIFLIIILLLTGVVDRLDRWTRKVQWKGLDIITVTDSIYGNIVMTKTGEEYSLYENGLLSFTTRDDLTTEESVHYPLLAHPDPRQILLLGTGIAGEIEEILKYPHTEVDYVELDPKVIQVAQAYLPREGLAFLEDSRVNTIYTDGRLFVKRAADSYDVIILNLGDPYTALINRYYTLEFFEEVHRILNPDGIIALSVTSSENYLNKETRAFLQSINSTLKTVFPDVKSIPGDTNIFLACKKSGVLTLDPQALIRRIKSRSVETKFVSESYLPFKLSEDRIRYIEDVLKKEGALNKDARPIAYLYDIVLWSTHFNGGFKDVFEKMQWVRFHHLLLVLIPFFIAGWLVKKVRPQSPITLSIVTTGFSEIIFQVIVILAFQTLYGYAYYKIGLIMTFFMLGLVLGSLSGRSLIARPDRDIFKIYKISQLGIFLYPLLLPVLFAFFREQINIGLFASIFTALPIVAGFMGGLQYPLANHLIHSSQEEAVGATSAGFLYAADVFGAMIGALLTGAILIPLLGINAVAFFCAALNGVVLILLLMSKA